MKKTIFDLHTKKSEHKPITMLTAYDYPTAVIEDTAGIDSILVGDSVGTNMLGLASEREVTMAHMLHHVSAVNRGCKTAFLIADLPFGAADTPESALENSLLLKNAGAACIKIEGWKEKRLIIEFCSKNNILMCGHIGYNPQIHGSKPKTFGREISEAQELIESAIAIEESGAQLLVIEKVPAELAGLIAKKLSIPVIGIGSGNLCDGQVLVINDVMGINERCFNHARQYCSYRELSLSALSAYIDEVTKKTFPGPENSAHSDPAEIEMLINKINL